MKRRKIVGTVIAALAMLSATFIYGCGSDAPTFTLKTSTSAN